MHRQLFFSLSSELHAATHVAADLRHAQQDPGLEPLHVLGVSADEAIEAVLIPSERGEEGVPRALDDLELIERLELADEVDHLGMDDAGVVPLLADVCSDAPSVSRRPK